MKALILCGIAALGPLASNANLIQNGSFESPGFSGGAWVAVPGGGTAIDNWVATENGADWHNEVQLSPAYDGDYVVDLTYGSDQGGISQTFATDLGQSYLLSFAMAGPYVQGFEDPRSLFVEVAGLTQTFTQLTSDPLGLVWGLKTLHFTAIDTSTTLSFVGAGTGDYWGALIDSVSVVPTSVPEGGSTLILSVLGCTALAMMRRRRRVQ